MQVRRWHTERKPHMKFASRQREEKQMHLHESDLPAANGKDRHDGLGRIAKRGVEQTADRFVRVQRELLGDVAEHACRGATWRRTDMVRMQKDTGREKTPDSFHRMSKPMLTRGKKSHGTQQLASVDALARGMRPSMHVAKMTP